MTETCRVTLGRKRDVADKLMILKWKIILDYLEGSFGGPARGFCRWLHLPMQETPETWVQSLGQEDPLEEEMATYSSILAREISWTEEPGRQ